MDRQSPALLPMKAAAEYLGVSYWTVRSWVEAGKLPAIRFSSRLVRVKRTELNALIERSSSV